MANQPDAVLSASELTLSYGAHQILDGATLAIRPGEKLGLLGRNGCGKSSLLKILAGQEQADTGTLSARQGLVVGYLSQEFTLDDSLTVEDNIRAGVAELVADIERFESGTANPDELERLQSKIDTADGWNLETRIASLMRHLATPPADRVVHYCSGGEKRRVGLCRALIANPDLLILDEPTNHLDSDAIEWLETYLADFRGACLFVTHDRYFLDRLVTHIVELDGGRLFSHEGNYGDFVIAKAERQERAEAAEHKRQRFLSREVEWVRAGVKARGTKQRSRLENFYAVKAQKAPDRDLDMELIVPPAPPLGNIVLDVEGVGMVAEVDPLFLGLTINFRAGECVGIVGRNGAGKTTLLRAMMGEIEPTEGLVRIGKKTIFNYVDQTRLQLDEDKSVLQEVAGDEDYVDFGGEKIPARSYLRRFLFSDERINDRVGHLSGGEKNRVLLAKILKTGGNFIVLDEPTNDLDLQTLRVLEEALLNFGGTSIVVSHDRYFLDRVCDRVIVYGDPPAISVFDGNYSYFRQKRKQLDQLSAAATPVAAAKVKAAVPSGPKPQARKLSNKENAELDGMEDTILEAETAVEEIQAKLDDPEFYIDHAEQAPVLVKDLETRRAEIEALYARWEELEDLRKAREGA